MQPIMGYAAILAAIFDILRNMRAQNEARLRYKH